MTVRAHEMDPPRPATSPAATWISHAAAPAFAVMALVTGLPGDTPAATCLGGAAPSFLGGMAWMYALMCVVHLPPWLRLLARLEAAAGRA